MKKSTPQKETIQGLELLQNPLISSIMFNLTAFEKGLTQKELLAILNKQKDANKGHGVRWAVKILVKNKLMPQEKDLPEGFRKNEGYAIKITNEEILQQGQPLLKEFTISNISSPTQRYVLLKNPIKFFFEQIEKQVQQKEKYDFEPIKKELTKLHKILMENFSLNPLPQSTKGEELKKDFEKKIEETKTNKKLNEKEKQEKIIIIQEIIEGIKQLEVHQKEFIENAKQTQKDFILLQRIGKLKYSELILNQTLLSLFHLALKLETGVIPTKETEKQIEGKTQKDKIPQTWAELFKNANSMFYICLILDPQIRVTNELFGVIKNLINNNLLDYRINGHIKTRLTLKTIDPLNKQISVLEGKNKELLQELQKLKETKALT